MSTTLNAQISSTSTGLLETYTQKQTVGFTRIHRLGSQTTHEFSPLLPRHTEEINSSYLIWGEGDTSQRMYPLIHSQGSLFIGLWDSKLRESTDYAQLGEVWGLALKELHSQTVSSWEQNPKIPRTAGRAKSWLESEQESQITRVVGEAHMDSLRSWLRYVVSSPRLVPAHGSPGFVHWLCDIRGQHGVLLTGEDIGFAHPEYDVGWTLGELAELYYFYPALRDSISALQYGILQGYGTSIKEHNFSQAIAFRLIQHAVDWQDYAGASPEQAGLLLKIATKYLER